MRRAARPAPACASKTTSASRPALPVRSWRRGHSLKQKNSACKWPLPKGRRICAATNVLTRWRSIDSGARVAARTIIIATGAEYRGLPIENIASFNGAGVYYLATPMEAQLCKGEKVIIVGGGNSAGQAAVFLAQNGSHVIMLVRSGGL